MRGDVHHGRDNCDGNGYVESSQIDLISSLTLPRFSPGGAGKHTWMSKMYIYISPYIMYMLVWIHKCMNISIYMIIYFLLGSRSPSRRSLSSSSPITHPSLSGEKFSRNIQVFYQPIQPFPTSPPSLSGEKYSYVLEFVTKENTFFNLHSSLSGCSSSSSTLARYTNHSAFAG